MIRDLADGSQRFCELERSLDGISPRTLSLRLRALEDSGIVERRTYPEVPPRVEYALTEKGSALVPADRGHARLRAPMALGERAPPRVPPSPCLSAGPATPFAVKECRCARAKRAGMRDLVVREALKEMVRRRRRSDCVSSSPSGRQVPYDVGRPAAASPLPQYVPLTARFIRDNSSALTSSTLRSRLRGDRVSRLAAALSGANGIARSRRPAQARRARRRRLPVPAVGRVDRLLARRGASDRAIAELEAGGEVTEDEIEVVVPIRGLQHAVARLELATATIVRADTVEVPPEARAAGGRPGAAGWEPDLPRRDPGQRRGARADEPRPGPTPARGRSRRFAS